MNQMMKTWKGKRKEEASEAERRSPFEGDPWDPATSNCVGCDNSAVGAPAGDHIAWSCVARNDIILAEAAATDIDDEGRKLVAQTAQELLRRKNTPGWEFHACRQFFPFRSSSTTGGASAQAQPRRLKGVKFHIYEHGEGFSSTLPEGGRTKDDDGVTRGEGEAWAGRPELTVWVFAAVYDGERLTKAQVQSYVEKIVAITEVFRDDDETFRHGGTLAAQATFAPILLQRMQEVTYLGKAALLEEKLESTKETMQRNIELILEREEKLEALDEEATRLQDMAKEFKKNANRVRRMKMMQDAKHGLIVGGLITATAAVIIVPPLVAIL